MSHSAETSGVTGTHSDSSPELFDVEEFLRGALNSESQKPCTYFAGAGISIDSGLPNFMTFGQNILKHIIGKSDGVMTDEEITRILLLIRPEILLQTLHKTFGDELLQFTDYLIGDTPNPAHEMLATALTKGHAVITTNLDPLIEKAYENLTGKKVRVVVNPEDFNTISYELEEGGKFSCPTVIKPHGTVDLQYGDFRKRYQSVRVCLDQVGQGLNESCRKVVQFLVRETPMVFLGYSGCDHFSLQPALCNTKTEEKAIWLFHDSVNDVSSDQEEIKKIYREILEQVYKGAVYADISRGMELHAMCIILTARKNMVRWRGSVSHLIREVTGRKDFKRLPAVEIEIPEWVKEIPEAKKHLMACRLFKLANMYDNVGRNSQKVLELATNDKKTMAEIKYLLADIQMEKSTGDASVKAKTYFQEAASLFSEINDECGANDCKIGIVNVRRRQREFIEALKDLDDLEIRLEQSMTYDGMKKHFIEIFFQRGLILGMCGDKSIEKKGKGAALLRSGLEFATRNGYPLRKAACLNALGLILFQESDKSEAKLLEAEDCLNQALELNIFCGLTRSCYQQYRNLGLIHAKLASLKQDEELKRTLYLQALEDYQNAEKYLHRTTVGFLEGEILEAKFRQGEMLVKLERDDEAIRILNYVIERRQHNKDWHNEARSIDLILQTKKEDVFCRFTGQLLDIYKSVLKDVSKMKLFKAQAFRFNNAKDILGNAINQALKIESPGLAEDLKQVLDSLKTAVSAK